SARSQAEQLVAGAVLDVHALGTAQVRKHDAAPLFFNLREVNPTAGDLVAHQRRLGNAPLAEVLDHRFRQPRAVGNEVGLAVRLGDLRAAFHALAKRTGPAAVPAVPHALVEIDVQAGVIALLAVRRALRAGRLLLIGAAQFHGDSKVGPGFHSTSPRGFCSAAFMPPTWPAYWLYFVAWKRVSGRRYFALSVLAHSLALLSMTARISSRVAPSASLAL